MAALLLLTGKTLAGDEHETKAAPLAKIPIHVMEYHLWYVTPFYGPEPQRFWRSWNSWFINRAIGPSWRRNTSSSGYPLIGPYNSADPEVIRWQLRLAKAAGIAALQVQLFPNQATGDHYGREDVFATVVKIAGEEQMPVYIHDEVQFRKPPANDPKMMAKRIIAAIKRFGAQPGYCKIGGKPAVSFQYWRQYMTADELRAMAEEVERETGGVHFVVNGNLGTQFADFAPFESMIATASSNLIKSATDRKPDLDWPGLTLRLQKLTAMRAAGFASKKLGLWAYPGFDSAPHKTPDADRWFPRGPNLESLRKTLTMYADAKPDFILISSWNDWLENTAIEPALDFADYNADPYQALRLIASLQGKTFTPPPLPPFASMDPWITAYHKGPDQTPPRIGSVWVAPNQSAVRYELVDETSPIGKIEVARVPAASVSWPEGKLESKGASAPADQTGLQQRLDRFGREFTKDFAFAISAEDFSQKKEAVWLAATLWDGERGVVKIEYPMSAGPRFEPTDEIPIRRMLEFPLQGTQTWRTMTFALEDLDVGPSRNTITIHPMQPAPANPVLIGAISVFRERDLQVSDLIVVGANPDRTVMTALARNIPWDPRVVRHALLSGQDTHGNRTLPLAVDVGVHKTSELFQLPF